MKSTGRAIWITVPSLRQVRIPRMQDGLMYTGIVSQRLPSTVAVHGTPGFSLVCIQASSFPKSLLASPYACVDTGVSSLMLADSSDGDPAAAIAGIHLQPAKQGCGAHAAQRHIDAEEEYRKPKVCGATTQASHVPCTIRGLRLANCDIRANVGKASKESSALRQPGALN
jgi:hypothetical protein